MAKFLNTSATNYFLEELIKGARERLIIISPFLKFNDRMKELLEDKNRLKIDVRVEAQRLIRISEEIRLSAETVERGEKTVEPEEGAGAEENGKEFSKLSTSRLAKELGMRTGALVDQLVAKGWLQMEGEKQKLTEAGKQAGGEFWMSAKFGPYFLWPRDLKL